MLAEVFRFELGYRLRQPAVYVFAALSCFMTFMAVSTDSVQIGGAMGNVARNSPYIITRLLIDMGMVGMIIVTILMASVVIRDRELGMQELFFTTPLSKGPFLAGRYLASVLLAVLTTGGAILGIVLASYMPWQDPDAILPFQLRPYLHAMAVFVVPNMLLAGAIFFSIAVLTRRALVTYVAMIGLMMLWAFSQAFLGDLDRESLAILVDPFGRSAFDLLTRYWTVSERNTLILPLAGPLLLNRLVWILVALALVAITGWRHRLTLDGTKRRARPGADQAAETHASRSPGARPPDDASRSLTPRFDRGARARQWLWQTRVETMGILKSLPFLVLIIFAVLNLLGNLIPNVDAARTYPVTQRMLSHISGGYDLFILIVVVLYAAELVWRERRQRIHELHDALPTPNWLPLGAKLAALAMVILVSLAIGMATTVIWQLLHGYFRIEPALYLKGLFLISFPNWLLLAALALFVQVACRQRYLGFLVMLVYFLANDFLPDAGYEHHLYLYRTTPSFIYSDMNGYGHYVAPLTWFNIYWAFLATGLIILADAFWPRGSQLQPLWKKRAAKFWTHRRTAALTACGLGFLLVGSWIFTNTNVLNPYRPKKERDRLKAAYEERYKQYEGIPQPRLTAASIEVALRPEERGVEIAGSYTLVNRSTASIDRLHLRADPDLEARYPALPAESLELGDEEIGYRIYRLTPALAPGDSMPLAFTVSGRIRGFVNNDPNTELVANGTFFDNFRTVPRIGYDSEAELEETKERKKRGLEPSRHLPAPDDATARNRSLFTPDADWIRFAAAISTRRDQIAIAPGYLEGERIESGRRRFEYAMDAPIDNFYAFLSGRYAVARDRWGDVAIEIYHHPDHGYNIERMSEAIKKTLAYCSENFGPYQHRQMRIIEFPRYRRFAQSFPNTVPFSEGAHFIEDLRSDKNIDMVFYLTAHEVAHQWWGHQVTPAHAQGGQMIAESLAQYSALMVMEKDYGRDEMRQFLAYELKRYLEGRGRERDEELPLMQVENQPYVYYNKGSLAFYALRTYIGEEALNTVLRDFVAANAFQGPPYATSPELVDRLRAATPEEYRYLITDLFHTITLYDNRTEKATVERTADGRYAVRIAYQSHKLRADGRGVETEIDHRDWIEVGIYGAGGDGDRRERPLHLERHQLASGTGEILITVDEEPSSAGIDPRHLLIDRVPGDNLKGVSS